MAALIDRRAFSDFHGLALLASGRLPKIEDTRRRIFIVERRSDVGRPDHFYKGYLDDRLGAASHVGELPLLVLVRLARRYMERRDGRIHVRYDRFNEWHELLPYISPLAVIVAFLVDEGRAPSPAVDPRAMLAVEIGHSALIGPADFALDDLVERKGLYELHMHLNGSTELDVIWPDACRSPRQYYKELAKGWQENEAATAELYEQMEPGLTPLALYRRIRAARRVRRRVAEAVAAKLGHRPGPSPAMVPGTANGMRGLLKLMVGDSSDLSFKMPGGPYLTAHPTRAIYPTRSNSDTLIEEAAWLYACLWTLKANPLDRVVGTGLYFNLLVYSQVARLSVQQADEKGFDQFQKYTFVGTRERIEQRYEARFRQLNGRVPFDTLAHLEGRFAPKGSPDKTRALLAKIIDGYLAFRGCRHRKNVRRLIGKPPPCLTGEGCDGKHGPRWGRPNAELSLVAHFIKRPPSLGSDTSTRCRDSRLRKALHDQARIVCNLFETSPIARILLRGVDAAANELHAPPEPFAPAFRMARNAGIPRATFHVGEDFRHLISGIRSVYEAMTFLDLGPGDRMGHATALGIPPQLWLDRTAPRSVMSQLDVLDDAVFAHGILARRGGFERDLFRLESLIDAYSEALYGSAHSPALLHRAWELRTLDVLELREVERELFWDGVPSNAGSIARKATFLARTKIDGRSAVELELIAKLVREAGAAYEVFSERHSLDRRRRTATVEVDAEVITPEAFGALQDEVLREAKRRGVALETLPTSNLRISFYDAMEEHHLFRWLGLVGPKLEHRPTVVVGSDDPGIFATSLKNEYAAVAGVLQFRYGKTAQEAIGILEQLADAGRVYRFKPGDPVDRWRRR